MASQCGGDGEDNGSAAADDDDGVDGVGVSVDGGGVGCCCCCCCCRINSFDLHDGVGSAIVIEAVVNGRAIAVHCL